MTFPERRVVIDCDGAGIELRLEKEAGAEAVARG
jgi:hypothetical protein